MNNEMVTRSSCLSTREMEEEMDRRTDGFSNQKPVQQNAETDCKRVSPRNQPIGSVSSVDNCRQGRLLLSVCVEGGAVGRERERERL